MNPNPLSAARKHPGGVVLVLLLVAFVLAIAATDPCLANADLGGSRRGHSPQRIRAVLPLAAAPAVTHPGETP